MAGGGPSRAARHAAAVVETDEQLLSLAVEYVTAGLDADDLTVVGARPGLERRLTEALGERAGAVDFDPRICLFSSRAPEVFSHTGRLAERATTRGSGRLRLLAQVDFGAAPRDVREGQCFESVANAMLGTVPVTALCLYDARELPAALVRSAGVTHPLVAGDDWRASPDFVDPVEFVRGLDVPREPIEDTPPLLAVDRAPTLPELRHAIGATLSASVPDRDQRDDLHLALSEMAANAFRHGAPPVSARLWASAGRLVCVIADCGPGLPDPLYGYWPAHGDDLGRGGMGLWLARKLCDHVDVLPRRAGFAVRLSTALR
ncbi:sensor histidine kinase [Geodermatophilus sp. YIM 151500]|nr:sensor histidine kinase [Geodermatophilus sp. YIM 151500]